jgi:hypothetical protein
MTARPGKVDPEPRESGLTPRGMKERTLRFAEDDNRTVLYAPRSHTGVPREDTRLRCAALKRALYSWEAGAILLCVSAHLKPRERGAFTLSC